MWAAIVKYEICGYKVGEIVISRESYTELQKAAKKHPFYSFLKLEFVA